MTININQVLYLSLYFYFILFYFLGMAGLVGMAVDGDPHFIIELPDRNDALCFNTDDKPGTIFNLVKDPVSGKCVPYQVFPRLPK